MDDVYVDLRRFTPIYTFGEITGEITTENVKYEQ